MCWVHFRDAELRLECYGRIKMRHANLPDRAVTNEVTEAKNVSNHCLVMRLAEHEGDELAHSGEEHHHLRCSLGFVREGAIVGLHQLLGNMERNLGLCDQLVAVCCHSFKHTIHPTVR